MPSAGPRVFGSHRAVQWPQEMLRRGAEAARTCMSRDSIIMASAVLSAAIRSEADVFELLPPSRTAPAGHAEVQMEAAIA
jgi:hypothetical protein